MKAKIDAYLLKELNRELCDLEQYDVDPRTRYFHGKALELYWTLSRVLGLGRLHDGRWRTPDPAKAQALRTRLEGDIPAPAERNRLLIDMTATHRFGGHSGVQRVVREIARACVESGEGIPVYLEAGRLHGKFKHDKLPDDIELQPGDTLLLLDSGWGFVDEYPPLLDAAREAGVEVVGCLYDLIPLRYPAATALKNSAPFASWFEKILLRCDAIVCISQSVVQDLVVYLREEGLAPPANMRIGWWPLGADFGAVAPGAPSKTAEQIATAPTPFFMSVGTLEPRKAYPIALDAFELLWSQGCDARYVIVGRPGWNTRALQRRIRQHQEFGRRLFWLDNASDADLSYLYPRARALIFPSFVEGFGMPLIEAAHYGAPVIASDIPVFREVGGDSVVYFDLLDAVSLAARISEIGEERKETHSGLPVLRWRDSAAMLATMLRENAYQLDVATLSDALASKDARAPKDKVGAYLLSQLYNEVCERSGQPLDARLSWAYDRAREFYWTASRLIRVARKWVGAAPQTQQKQPPDWMIVEPSAAKSSRGRLLIDVTTTWRADVKTGIQRVVREVVKASLDGGRGLPVAIVDGRLSFFSCDAPQPQPVTIEPGDKFLLLDAGWIFVEEYDSVLESVRAQGGEIIVCLYDLFPLVYAAAFPYSLQIDFRKWFERVILRADHIVAISHSVARAYENYCAEHSSVRKDGQTLRVWWLGADFSNYIQSSPTTRVRAISEARRPFFLSVGTLAPNKGQALCLAAFEKLWAAGVDATLAIVGRPGWNTTALARSLREHPEHGRRLFWLSDASDAELQSLYRSARAVICASYAEGFGLPLIEAAHAGAPVIASDIEIFHEVGGDAITYFDMLDPESLKERIVEVLASEKRAHPLPALSWKESTQNLLDMGIGADVRDAAI
ncbi:glycosyltransferase family 4 protein [Methylocystis sp.]|uniref:glycosyltransferase family 4 protein n=1 Tax=Methylocystis sp. TaxID=1911079 RepID=UPI003D11CABF